MFISDETSPTLHDLIDSHLANAKVATSQLVKDAYLSTRFITQCYADSKSTHTNENTTLHFARWKTTWLVRFRVKHRLKFMDSWCGCWENNWLFYCWKRKATGKRNVLWRIHQISMIHQHLGSLRQHDLS